MSGPKRHTPDVLAQAQAARRAQPVQAVAATAAMAPGGVERSAGTSHPADLVVDQPVAQVSMALGELFSGVNTPACRRAGTYFLACRWPDFAWRSMHG